MSLFTYGAIGLTSIILAIITIYDSESGEPAVSDAMSDSSEMLASIKSYLPSMSNEPVESSNNSLFGTTEKEATPEPSMFGTTATTEKEVEEPSIFGTTATTPKEGEEPSMFGTTAEKEVEATAPAMFGTTAEEEPSSLFSTEQKEVSGGKRKTPRNKKHHKKSRKNV